MKKTLLAVAIPTLLIANTANAYELINEEGKYVELYGQIRTVFKQEEDKDTKLDAGSSRTGVKAKFAVNDQVSVFGQYEVGMTGDIQSRLHFGGVETNYGKVSFGFQTTPADDVWGADYSNYYGGAPIGFISEAVTGGKLDSMIKYVYEGESFWINSAYNMSEDRANPEATEFFVGTSFGNLNLHAGGGVVSAAAFADAGSRDVKNTHAEVTAEYTMGAAGIAFTYLNGSIEDKSNSDSIDMDGYQLSGVYSFNSQANAYAGYEFVNYDVSNGMEEDFTQIYVGTTYKVNSWSKAFLEYAYNDGATIAYEDANTGNGYDTKIVDGDNKIVVGYYVYF
ncbi:porin [Photobacterium sp. WH77]|uniref:porin n=1 Tax=unclassified Photobacterium TaxID=2628852 RepID=UPI001EDB3325|nr:MULTISPECIES: porin [unclassified Photobacterium]MCG2835815.1 porin [Photobacterium sp. WH77]MCG2843508.1 porin [Photobacterium sp. WH80]MDO6579855.1 porin [Photobacterium sp. 2_MG-2023]